VGLAEARCTRLIKSSWSAGPEREGNKLVVGTMHHLSRMAEHSVDREQMKCGCSCAIPVSREAMIGPPLRGVYASRTRDGVQALRESCPPSGRGRDACAASNSSHALTWLIHARRVSHHVAAPGFAQLVLALYQTSSSRVCRTPEAGGREALPQPH
jgi:hypothetical protein